MLLQVLHAIPILQSCRNTLFKYSTGGQRCSTSKTAMEVVTSLNQRVYVLSTMHVMFATHNQEI